MGSPSGYIVEKLFYYLIMRLNFSGKISLKKKKKKTAMALPKKLLCLLFPFWK
jgi:hypothetical protein